MSEGRQEYAKTNKTEISKMRIDVHSTSKHHVVQIRGHRIV